MPDGYLDLHQVVGRCVDEMRVVFPQALLNTDYRGVGTAHLDGDRVQQLIGNLVANSVAYGDRSRPITITSTLEDGTAIVSVHNYGSAIPDSLKAVLFEPMTRGIDDDKEARSVGLGLFILKEIAKAHRGDVLVDSSENDGTVFGVHFPRS